MKSWPQLDLPEIPGTSPVLRVRERESGRLTEVPGRDGVARLYVCGITPYDATHLGHAATYVTFDLVNRALRAGGLEVRYVQNVTDVDDPLLERAERDGLDWRDLAADQIALFAEDMTALAVLPPDELVGVVESVDLIGAAVRELDAAGATYVLPNDDLGSHDIYLDLSRVDQVNLVSGFTREEMSRVIVERGGDPDRPGKRDPMDPLLWRAVRPGEPSWDVAGLPPGRPGWHIECTAIARDRLGLPLDIQGGGIDLTFPHHDMSQAQAAALGQPYALTYLHQAMVGLHGEKMSKSKGNLILVSALRADGHDPMAIRLLLLAHRYDQPWEFTDADLQRAGDRLAHWRTALSVNEGPEAQETVDAIRLALATDLDTPAALAAVDEWATRCLEDEAAGSGGDPGAPGLLARSLDALLGVRV